MNGISATTSKNDSLIESLLKYTGFACKTMVYNFYSFLKPKYTVNKFLIANPKLEIISPEAIGKTNIPIFIIYTVIIPSMLIFIILTLMHWLESLKLSPSRKIIRMLTFPFLLHTFETFALGIFETSSPGPGKDVAMFWVINTALVDYCSNFFLLLIAVSVTMFLLFRKNIQPKSIIGVILFAITGFMVFWLFWVLNLFGLGHLTVLFSAPAIVYFLENYRKIFDDLEIQLEEKKTVPLEIKVE